MTPEIEGVEGDGRMTNPWKNGQEEGVQPHWEDHWDQEEVPPIAGPNRKGKGRQQQGRLRVPVGLA